MGIMLVKHHYAYTHLGQCNSVTMIPIGKLFWLIHTENVCTCVGASSTTSCHEDWGASVRQSGCGRTGGAATG